MPLHDSVESADSTHCCNACNAVEGDARLLHDSSYYVCDLYCASGDKPCSVNVTCVDTRQ